MSTDEVIEAKAAHGPRYDPAIAASSVDVDAAERARRLAIYARYVERGEPIKFIPCPTQRRHRQYWQDVRLCS